MNTLIGNIISIFADLCLVASSLVKEKKAILFYQMLFCFLIGTSSIVLGAYSAAAINLLGIIRNLCVMFNKNTDVVNVSIFVSTVIVAIIFNNNGYFGIFPIISACIENYLILKPNSSARAVKLAFAVSCFCWIIFNLVIKNYVSAVFNGITVILNVAYLIRHKK